MKGKTKTQKGITLVALIITIIVLLILAVVAITAIQNDGIFSHANNAATKFNDAQGNEQNNLNTYEDLLNRYAGGSSTVVTPGENDGDGDETPVAITWTQSGTTITSSNGDSIPVGATVSGYDETKGGEVTVTEDVNWGVLGANAAGQLLIVSTTRIEDVTGSGSYDSYCVPYGNGTFATGTARSIEVADINRVTGYTVGDNYNTEVTYAVDDNGYLTHKFGNAEIVTTGTKAADSTLYMYGKGDGILDTNGESFTEFHTSYTYNQTLTDSHPLAYNLLFTEEGTTFDSTERSGAYWLDDYVFNRKRHYQLELGLNDG